MNLVFSSTLESFFNAAASQFILGQSIPITLWLSLAPVVLGVSMESLTELSFNWLGFISAMISNISFTYKSIYSKKAMTDMDSTNIYAYISIIALIVSIPPALIIEGPILLKTGFNVAIAKLKEHASIEIRKADAEIIRCVSEVQQLELKLGHVSANDYRAILVPLVKALLEDLAEKYAREKSDAAGEAFLAELALIWLEEDLC